MPIFEPISKYVLKIEDKINNFLRKIKTAIGEDLYKKFYVSGSGPGILYSLSKIHKPDFASKFQFRPIFAAYDTPSFNIAKYLVQFLSSFTCNQYTVSNSYRFCEDIRNIPNCNSLIMASFDIDNLFTNVPLSETIEICLNYLFNNNITTVLGLTRELFCKLLEIAVKNSYFIFDGSLYRQIEGLGMGLPLGPTFANIFMCFNESKWLDDCPNSFKPVFYHRYIDDIFMLFNDESHVLLFFKTSVYRKSMFTGLGTSFFSFTPFIYKLNSIRTLIFRGFKVCSTYKGMHSEFNFLKEFFFNNGYPLSLLNSQIKKFLHKQFLQPTSASDNREKVYISFPYFDHQSETMKCELNKLLVKYIPNTNFNISLVNKYTIKNFFNYKDRLPGDVRSSFVYSFCCSLCERSYIGSSTRSFYIRVAEHAGRSFRTGMPLSSPPFSAIRDHCHNECNSDVKTDNFKILDYNSDTISLRLLESLYIFRKKPPLNNMQTAFPLLITN